MENTIPRILPKIRLYDNHVCHVCSGTKEVDISADIDEEELVPCPECQSSFYEEGDTSDSMREQ
jgi:hypothetical protein